MQKKTKKKKKEKNLNPYLVPYSKINTKLDHRYKFTSHNYKTSRRNHRRKFCDLGLSKIS